MIVKSILGLILCCAGPAYSDTAATLNLGGVANPGVGPVDDELEDYIIVPFQGTWVQGANSFIFTAGDTRQESGWVEGNVIGGAGVTNRYLWYQTGVVTGQFYFDTQQGRQGPLFVTLSNNNRRMTWRFGNETTVLNKVN